MRISILTLFPEMFAGPFDHSIIKRAKEKGLVEISYINIRDFGIGKHKVVDDTPYGGGNGMVLKVDVVHAAIEYAKQQLPNAKTHVVLMSARGTTFTQNKAQTFATIDHLIIICGHYEGLDERISHFIDEEISIGDFVLTGGELPAMLLTDAVVRLIPGVVREGTPEHESFSLEENGETYLEYPQYTNPREYQGHVVPEVILSGDHKKVHAWRMEQAKQLTNKRRPDLLTASYNDTSPKGEEKSS